jgi:hypothetical protein
MQPVRLLVPFNWFWIREAAQSLLEKSMKTAMGQTPGLGASVNAFVEFSGWDWF